LRLSFAVYAKKEGESHAAFPLIAVILAQKERERPLRGTALAWMRKERISAPAPPTALCIKIFGNSFLVFYIFG
jgi:hypothetical protein